VDKGIFGADFRSFTPEETINGMLQVNEFASHNWLPGMDEPDLQAIIHDNYERRLGKVL